MHIKNSTLILIASCSLFALGCPTTGGSNLDMNVDGNIVDQSRDALATDQSGQATIDSAAGVDQSVTDLATTDLTGMCTLPEKLCQGSCINFDTNVAHCGMCGHACTTQQGKEVSCQAGQCVYQRTVATLDGNQTLLTADNDSVYVTEDDDTPQGSSLRSRIVKINKATGNRQTLVSALEGEPKALQIIDDMLYFVGRNSGDLVRGVGRVPLAGGQMMLVTNLSQSGIDLIDGQSAWDGTYFYILRYDSNDNTYLISRTDLVGTPPVNIVRRSGTIRAVTVDAENIYFSGDVGSSYTIYKLPKTSDTPAPFIENISTPFSLANDASNLYWLEYQSTGAVAKSGKTNPSRTLLASGHGNPSVIFLSSSFVYWTGNTAGLYRVGNSGGTEQPLGTGYAEGLTVDSSGRIYWLVYDYADTKKTTLFETTL